MPEMSLEDRIKVNVHSDMSLYEKFLAVLYSYPGRELHNFRLSEIKQWIGRPECEDLVVTHLLDFLYKFKHITFDFEDGPSWIKDLQITPAGIQYAFGLRNKFFNQSPDTVQQEPKKKPIVVPNILLLEILKVILINQHAIMDDLNPHGSKPSLSKEQSETIAYVSDIALILDTHKE